MMEEVKCGIVKTIPLGHDWEVCPIQLEKFFIKFLCFEKMSSKGAQSWRMAKGVDTKDHLNSNDHFEECNTFDGSDQTYKITN